MVLRGSGSRDYDEGTCVRTVLVVVLRGRQDRTYGQIDGARVHIAPAQPKLNVPKDLPGTRDSLKRGIEPPEPI